MTTQETLERLDQTPEVKLSSGTQFSIKLLAVIAACLALYFARSFFLPIVLAFILALTLSPLIQFGKRLKLPSKLSAVILMLAFSAGIALSVVSLADPLSSLIAEAPRMGAQLKSKLEGIRSPVDKLNEVGKEVEKITEAREDISTQEVVVKQPGLIVRAADDLVGLMATTILTMVLLFFLLVSRDILFEKIVSILPKLKDKKRALLVVKKIERDVSGYLLTITVINACLGICVALAFWAFSMPNPILWGILAALLNFLPYIGSLAGIVTSTAFAIVAFPTLSAAFLPPLAYLIITLLEGQFVTPILLGRRFSLNTVFILVSIAFWGFLWGPVGIFIAMPLLIVLKVFCDNVEAFSTLGKLISGKEV